MGGRYAREKVKHFPSVTVLHQQLLPGCCVPGNGRGNDQHKCTCSRLEA